MLRILILSLLGATALHAQTAEPIPLEDWEGIARGNTIYYFIDGEFFGREYYARQGNSVQFQHVSGTCQTGTWSYSEPTFAYCFDWSGRQSCFQHLREGDAMSILPIEPDGVPNGNSIQSVGSIQAGSFTCMDGATS